MKTNKKQNLNTSISHKKYMQMAINLSEIALDTKQGGPFGAVIIKEGRVVGSSGNCVFLYTDPTAHAEVMAIRDACKNLKTLDLNGCVIYSSTEPCPMCTAAIYWAHIKAVYYSNTEDDALNHGFIDKIILAELKKSKDDRKLKFVRLEDNEALRIFVKAVKNT